MSDTAPRKYGRRAILGTVAATTIGAPFLGLSPAQAAPVLRWSPVPSRDGLNAFEGVEDDRANSHPDATHIYVSGDTYRFNMHTRDRDGSDRQRSEVRGIRTSGGSVLNWLSGETWQVTYDMYIPGTLRGTTSFTHIFQLKKPGTGTDPLATVGLRRSGSNEYMTLRPFLSGGEIGRVALSSVWNSWIQIDMTFKIGNSGSGRFVVKKNGSTLTDASRSGIDLWLSESIRPKWGIYRSLDDSAQLKDTYLQLRNLKAYKL
jgi:chitin-binding protein